MNDEVYVELFQETLSLAEEEEEVVRDLNKFIDFVESILPVEVLKQVRDCC
jgi:ethanolamine utilization cobalamin adenosyltransferase